MEDYLDKLERLTSLFERGALSKDEFDSEKRRLLQPAVQEPTAEIEPRFGHSRRKHWFVGAGVLATLIAAVIAAAVTLGGWPQRSAVKAEDSGKEQSNDIGLNSVIQFQDASSCLPGSGFEDLLDRIATSSQEGSSLDRLIRVAGFSDPFEADAVTIGAGQDQATISRIHLQGEWQGLHVTELRTTRWADELTEAYQIRFSESPREVSAVLRQVGLPIKTLDKLSTTNGAMMGLEAASSGSAFVCIRRKHEVDSPASAET